MTDILIALGNFRSPDPDNPGTWEIPGRDEPTRPRSGYARYMRNRLLAGLLTPPCPVCPSLRGEPCPWPCHIDAELVRVNYEPLLMLHTARIATAIERGLVVRRTVLDQFPEGRAPAGLARRGRRWFR